jgi:hypothetical protein
MFDCTQCYQFFKLKGITRCSHDGFKIRRVNCKVPSCDFYYSYADVRAGFNGIERVLSCYPHDVIVVFDYSQNVYLGKGN